MVLRRLLPDGPAEVTPAEVIHHLGLADLAPDDRPHVVLNMVATFDGRAAIGGRSGPIGDEVDREIFRRLRTQVDAVLVGTGTLEVERYGPLVPDAGLREARRREGLEPTPLACIITHERPLPVDIPLFQDPEARIAVFTAASEPLVPTPARVSLTRMPTAELEPDAVLRRLRAEHGVRSVLCEGGPRLNAGLLDAGVVDELFLTMSAKLAGGSEPTIVGPAVRLEPPLALEPVWVLEAAGNLYLRYRLPTAG